MSAAARSQPMLVHIQELRRRLLWCIGTLLLAAGVSYIYRQPLIEFVARPIHQSLFYTSPSGSFDFVMRVCLSVGAIAALPIGVYNLIRFVEPAFERQRMRRRTVAKVILSSLTLAWMGLIFAYAWVLPASFNFFAGFNVGPVKPLISTSEYLSFVLGCLVVFAAIFQLPLILLLFNNIRRFPPGGLRRYRRFVIIGSLLVAAILPFTYDPMTQFIIAIPVIALYELSVLAIWMVNRRPAGQVIHTGSAAPATPPSALAQPLARPPRRLVQLG